MDFTAALLVLRDLGAEVLGISRDSPASHRKFAEKHSLKVMLASDQEHKVTEAYGAWALQEDVRQRELWRDQDDLSHRSAGKGRLHLEESCRKRAC